MRNLTAVLFLLSLCSLYVVFSEPSALEYKNKCCPNITKAKIPLKNIVTYVQTGSSCPIKAVIFKTKAKRKICVDPEAPWVSTHMKAVDLRKNTESKP